MDSASKCTQYGLCRNGYSTDESFNSLDTDEISSDCEISSRKSKHLKLTNNSNVKSHKKQAQLQQRCRRPTRVPDPNTFNRNALMARENRRKKKEYLENLEKEIENVRRTNQILIRKVSLQTKLIESLKDEQKYFQNILRNKKEVLSICNALNLPSPLQNENDLRDDRSSEHQFNTPVASPNYYDDYNYSTNYKNEKSAFDDLPMLQDDNWETLLDYNSTNCSEFSSSPPSNVIVEPIGSIISEHNYTNSKESTTPQYDDDEDDTEVCSHVIGGKRISIQFCSKCNKNPATLVKNRLQLNIGKINDEEQLDVVNL